MAEAVSAQTKVAQAVLVATLTVEREPLPVQMEPAPDNGNGKSTPRQVTHQLTMTDLWQRHGAQATRRQRRESRPVVGYNN